MIRLLVLALIIALPIIYFAQASSDGVMNNSGNNGISSFDLIYGAQDIPKIKHIVDEFLELREIIDTPQAETKALEIDKEINQLVLVEKYCNELPSSLDLARASNPYKELQQICPELDSIDFSKAVSIWENFI